MPAKKRKQIYPTQKRYSPEVRAEIKKLFVQDGLSAKSISGKSKKYPTHQQITRWANEKINGLSWKDEREEFERNLYENLSPQNQAQKIMKRINYLLNKDITHFNTKEADALAKLNRLMEKIVNKEFQIPMMYELLTKLVEFLQEHYKEFITEEFLNAVRHFKNNLKEGFE